MKIRSLLALFIFMQISATAAVATEQTEPGLHGFINFVFVEDNRIGWTGSETTFYTTAKLDYLHMVSDDTTARFSGSFTPTVSDHSRAYDILKKREGNIEDTYVEYNHFISNNSALKFGVVKVPFGHFDTFANEDRNRPVSMQRTRTWDYGIRLDTRFSFMDMSVAAVNGEGTSGTDANSAKSVVLRFEFPAGSDGDATSIYPEVEQITNYHNPRIQNLDGSFDWHFGISGYAGNRYTTPVKEKNNHYGVDLELGYSVAALKLQATYHEGFFNNRSVAQDDINRISGELKYGPAVTLDIDDYPHALSSFVELVIGLSDKAMLTLMYEYYDPDIDSAASVTQVARERIVIGWKRDFRENSTFAFLYTINNNPAFSRLIEGSSRRVNVVETDDMEGDNALMMSVAVQF